MKPFYSPVVQGSCALASGTSSAGADRSAISSYICTRARIAVYDTQSAAPRVVDIEPAPTDEFIGLLSARIHELSSEQGGGIPYTVIREVAENFIHADFLEPVVSILDSGATIRFADQGPGFPDKTRALLPGFTTARGSMKRFIRGVGSGLPIVRDYLVHTGGSLQIEDNLGAGSVVTIRVGTRGEMERPSYARLEPAVHRGARPVQTSLAEAADSALPTARPRLSSRQHQVLALVLETGLAGPSLVSKEMGIGISTAYRDLAALEEAGLIASDSGKRALTAEGLAFLDELLNHS
jgi:DNA-binding MarR family transcriptional regulator